jgi:hypothetical protein
MIYLFFIYCVFIKPQTISNVEIKIDCLYSGRIRTQKIDNWDAKKNILQMIISKRKLLKQKIQLLLLSLISWVDQEILLRFLGEGILIYTFYL